MTHSKRTPFEPPNEISRQKFVIMVMAFLLLAAGLVGMYLLSSQQQVAPISANDNLLSQQDLTHLSLQAVVIGSASALVIQIAFNLIAISLGILKSGCAVGLNRVSVSWLIFITLIAGLIGGHVTTTLANLPYVLDSLLHAGLVWIVSLFITAISVFIYTEMPQSIAFLTVPDQHFSR